MATLHLLCNKFVIKPVSNDGAVCQRFAAMFGQAWEKTNKASSLTCCTSLTDHYYFLVYSKLWYYFEKLEITDVDVIAD